MIWQTLISAFWRMLALPCCLCGLRSYTDYNLCRYCQAALPWQGLVCQTCALPLAPVTVLPSTIPCKPQDITFRGTQSGRKMFRPYQKIGATELSNTSFLCGRCLQRPPPHSQLLAAFEYQQPLESLIYQFKFGQRLDIGLVLAKCFYQYLLQQQRQKWPDYLIPVPLHRRRLRERGYNQAAELCKHLSRWLSIPSDLYSCRRIRHTQAQTLIASKARQRNIRGAFKVSSRFHAQHVAIIDDVYTSGSTTQELTRMLKLAGVEIVEVWVIARAGLGRRVST